jgi:hypothetical protein
MNALDTAKMDDKAFWAELDNCDGPEDAIAICNKWIEMAQVSA